jgi:hypothetical protein
MEPEVELWEVPTEEATVKSLGTMKKWHELQGDVESLRD